VPALARWDFIKDSAKVANGTKLQVKNGKIFEYEFRGIGRLLDDALPGLIDEFSKIQPLNGSSLKAKDILGHVYEYFLGEFSIPQPGLHEGPRAARLQARRCGQGGPHLPRLEARPSGGRTGYAKAATLSDIRQHDHVLTPGRYVGAAAQEEDGEAFEDRMARLTATLSDQFAESARLETAIRKNLAGLGYPLKTSV
jgi:type I restriction-modification system DNA methylase subunit